MKNSGFTLLEVLIAMSLIAVLSVFTTQSIQRAIRTRAKVQHTIEVNGQMREALRLIERDIRLAFHHRDFSTDLYNKAEQERIKNANNPQNQNNQQTPPGQPPGAKPPVTPQQPATQQAPFTPKNPPPQLTQFVGEAEVISLTTSTRARTLQDELTSDLQKVGYFIKECRNRHNRSKTSKCLWRRSDPYLDEDVTKGGDEVPLLENVSSLQIRYLGDGREEWADKWNSKDGAADEKDKFPLAVEVTLTVLDPSSEAARDTKPRKVVMQTVAAIRFPNNAKETQSDQSQQGGTPVTAPGRHQ